MDVRSRLTALMQRALEKDVYIECSSQRRASSLRSEFYRLRARLLEEAQEGDEAKFAVSITNLRFSINKANNTLHITCHKPSTITELDEALTK